MVTLLQKQYACNLLSSISTFTVAFHSMYACYDIQRKNRVGSDIALRLAYIHTAGHKLCVQCAAPGWLSGRQRPEAGCW